MTSFKPQTSQLGQTNAFAMNYALLFGLYWVAGFLCFIYSFKTAGASFGFVFIFVSTPFVGYYMTRRFRERAGGGILSLGRGYMFALLLYFYSALILAAGVYIYFEYFDGGNYLNAYATYLDSPDGKKLFANAGIEQMTGGITLNDMKSVVSNLQELSSVAISANILDFSIFSGILLSLPTALLAMRRRK